MLVGGTQRKTPAPAPAEYSPPAWQARSNLVVTWVIVSSLLMTGLTGLILYIGALQPKASPRSSSIVSPASESPLESRVEPAPKFSFIDPPMLFDVDADYVDDVVGACCDLESTGTYWIGAFSGKDGHLLWRSEGYSWVAKGFRAIAGKWVIVADLLGLVRALDIATGKGVWKAKLASMPIRICASNDSLGFEMNDKKIEARSLSTGQGQPLAGLQDFCGPVYSTLSDEAPNFQVRSKLTQEGAGSRRRTHPFEISGTAIDRVLVPTSGRARVVLGHQSAGSAIPVVAVVAGGKVLWQKIIADKDPETASPSLAPKAAVRRERVVVPYEQGNPRVARLSCFSLASGKRQWDVELSDAVPGDRRLAVSHDGKVFVATRNGALSVFDLETGSFEFYIGQW
jgi:hypothetical protein